MRVTEGVETGIERTRCLSRRDYDLVKMKGGAESWVFFPHGKITFVVSVFQTLDF